jgi:hypothetical protein
MFLLLVAWFLLNPVVVIPAFVIGAILARRLGPGIVAGAAGSLAAAAAAGILRESSFIQLVLLIGMLWAAIGGAAGRKLRTSSWWLSRFAPRDPRAVADSLPGPVRKGVDL